MFWDALYVPALSTCTWLTPGIGASGQAARRRIHLPAKRAATLVLSPCSSADSRATVWLLRGRTFQVSTRMACLGERLPVDDSSTIRAPLAITGPTEALRGFSHSGDEGPEGFAPSPSMRRPALRRAAAAGLLPPRASRGTIDGVRASELLYRGASANPTPRRIRCQ